MPKLHTIKEYGWRRVRTIYIPDLISRPGAGKPWTASLVNLRNVVNLYLYAKNLNGSSAATSLEVHCAYADKLIEKKSYLCPSKWIIVIIAPDSNNEELY
jgi:hypothetical protein